MEQTRVRSIDAPSLRLWTEPSVWLEAHSKSGPAKNAAPNAADAISVSPASRRGSTVEAPPGGSDAEIAKSIPAAIDVEISDAIVGITAEAQGASRSVSSGAGDEIGSALNDLTAMAEKIRKGWSAG